MTHCLPRGIAATHPTSVAVVRRDLDDRTVARYGVLQPVRLDLVSPDDGRHHVADRSAGCLRLTAVSLVM